MSGQKIIDGLKDAVAGNFARVMIDGQVWVREPHMTEPEMEKMVEAGGRAIAEQVASPNCALFDQCAAEKECVCRNGARLAITAAKEAAPSAFVIDAELAATELRERIASTIATKFPAILGQYSQYKIADTIIAALSPAPAQTEE